MKAGQNWLRDEGRRKGKGKGYVVVPIRFSDVAPRIAGRTKILSTRSECIPDKNWHDDDYLVTRRVSVPIGARDLKGPQLGAYLADVGAVDVRHCMHSYDCCGNYYPSQAKIIERRGRTLVITQIYQRNI